MPLLVSPALADSLGRGRLCGARMVNPLCRSFTSVYTGGDGNSAGGGFGEVGGGRRFVCFLDAVGGGR